MLLLRLQRTCVYSYLAAVALQVYMLGLALFGVTSFMPHAIWGYLMILGALLLVVLTLSAKLPRRAVWLSIGVLSLTILQPVLVLMVRGSAPALAALHPLNALVIFALAASVARSTALR
jgi:energy-coupling factor transporter transmembrane protein EcfT